MLLRTDATYIDDATKRAERVFPRGGDWLKFESELPGAEVFANSVLDPAIGIGGKLGVKTFAAADYRNWTKALQVGLFEIGTRVGLPPLENGSLHQGLAIVYSTLHTTVNTMKQHDDLAELIPELVKNVALQVLNQVLKSNVVTYVVAQVVQLATWAVGVAQSAVEESLGKNISLPPLQSEDPTTDTWQVNRIFEVFRSLGHGGGVVYPDGKVEAASNADYTSLFLPAYRPTRPWRFQYRDNGIAAQQGTADNVDGLSYKFDAGDASTFGFMPGAGVMLRVLQASNRFYYTTRGTPVDRYTLRCKGVDKTCWKGRKTFRGDRDCRQCVDGESVWPVQGIGWAYGGAPLNATTPGENVGAFYPSANKLLANVLDAIAQPGPLLYTVDIERINRDWQDSFERFWDFVHSEWARYGGYGWRGLISRLATLMTAFEHQGEMRVGGRDAYMPLELIGNPRESTFNVSIKNSIYSKLIRPFCRDLNNMQGYYLDTVQVAYIPPGAGAIYSSSGKIRRSKLGDYFLAARSNLLASTKRVLVDLRQVSDPEYRAELEKAGVKPSPVNAALHGSPGVSGHEILKPEIKPRRAPRKPKVSRVSPLEASVKLVRLAQRPKLQAKFRRVPTATSTPKTRPSGLAIGGVVTGSVVVTAAALAYLRSLDDEDGSF